MRGRRRAVRMDCSELQLRAQSLQRHALSRRRRRRFGIARTPSETFAAPVDVDCQAAAALPQSRHALSNADQRQRVFPGKSRKMGLRRSSGCRNEAQAPHRAARRVYDPALRRAAGASGTAQVRPQVVGAHRFFGSAFHFHPRCCIPKSQRARLPLRRGHFAGEVHAHSHDGVGVLYASRPVLSRLSLRLPGDDSLKIVSTQPLQRLRVRAQQHVAPLADGAVARSGAHRSGAFVVGSAGAPPPRTASVPELYDEATAPVRFIVAGRRVRRGREQVAARGDQHERPVPAGRGRSRPKDLPPRRRLHGGLAPRRRRHRLPLTPVVPIPSRRPPRRLLPSLFLRRSSASSTRTVLPSIGPRLRRLVPPLPRPLPTLRGLHRPRPPPPRLPRRKRRLPRLPRRRRRR
mmetsp:Transcript_24650/g.76136  ORF Transcript_24650/g.76136 Transcript_24650/m.76136 type:complete len:404 (+) Transcript_24650:572-1783(+)